MAFTFFFRDNQTIEQTINSLLPRISGRSNIKIWNPGCASGQETYTLLIQLAEKMGHFAFKNIELIATDIDISSQFREIIMKGVYPYEQLQRIPEHLFAKYFTKAGGEFYCIDNKLTSRIKYIQDDLTRLNPPGNDFSLILCKNVLLHLDQKQRVEVIKMFHSSLTKGGIFATEQTQKLPDEVEHLFIPAVTNAQIFTKK